MPNGVRKRFAVRGLVQGVGFRPFAYRLAAGLGLTGRVGNDGAGAWVEVQGPGGRVAEFARVLWLCPPPARVEAVDASAVPATGETDFAIVASEAGDARGAALAADTAPCGDCLREFADPTDRRYRYPFIACARCGPRYTIARSLPFDRAATAMAEFPLCRACESEYRDPADRRFHAQTTACPACGPRVWFGDSFTAVTRVEGAEAISAAKRALAEGRIVAVKGVGGYHLACDAADDAAVQRLREKKARADKPFALLAASVDVIRGFTDVSVAEEQLLTGPERPVVLLTRRGNGASLSPAVAPGVGTLGFLLPYSPLHALLLSDGPLVLTSANGSGDPVLADDAEAASKLEPVAGAVLGHDRAIHARCDDSVVREFRGRVYPVRRARGYAPLPISLGSDGATVLAVGGELKATICLANGDRAYLGPHVGDVGNLETLAVLKAGIEHFRRLFTADLCAVACDAHPGYLSCRLAAEYAGELGVPLVRIPHHAAHVASLAADAGHTGPLLGVCFDGTGYGDDGAVWGGEFFVSDGPVPRRAAHCKYVPLPGGDAAVEKPYRAALAHLWAAGVDWVESLPCVAAASPAERTVLVSQLNRNFACPPTSSVGRLFDAVASILGVRQSVTYEAQAAVELEAVAENIESDGYDFGLLPGDPLRIDPAPVIRQVVEDYLRGVPVSVIAGRFHAAVAGTIHAACHDLRGRTGISTVGLTGGVFQNMRLLRLAAARLEADGFTVLVHRHVPCNDGGLALGQVVLARRVV